MMLLRKLSRSIIDGGITMIKQDQFEYIDTTLTKEVVLGEDIKIEDLVNIARYNYEVKFSRDYETRVCASRKLVEKWIKEERVMYGITTGFGALSTKVISVEETERLQRNIILSHSTSVGEPLKTEEVRAIMVLMLQSLGQGLSGVRLKLLQQIQTYLNMGITPFAPREGSVGYLSVEGHIGLALIGLGKVYYNGQLQETGSLLIKLGLEPLVLAAKEGLALISGTTSPTGLSALALNDMLQAAKSADVIGAMCLEVSKGTLRAYDERLMNVKPYKEQKATASNVRRILADSEIAKKNINYRLQDALSIRAIPQLHGAAKRTLFDARRTIEEELNYCGDNPIIWADEEGTDGEALSGCHCDASYVGLEMDSSCIAATMIAKMSERRNYRMTTATLSEMPWFLIKNPGVNSGLMIPQYSQAGLLNDMKILSTSAVIDNVPTCGGQEDYVSMGYNAAKKSLQVAEKLEYILAIELLSAYQAHQFIEEDQKPSLVTNAVMKEMSKFVSILDEDEFLQPYIESIKAFIHSGKLLKTVEEKIGEME